MKDNLKNIKHLLLVVDMVNGFVKEGKMADPRIQSIIPNIRELLKLYMNKYSQFGFIRDAHNMICREFDRYPIHCLKNTNESELVDELLPFQQFGLDYEKNSTSTIYANNFISDIDRMVNLEDVVIAGCCTDICVLNLAIPLQNYFDEYNRRVQIIVPKNAVETFDGDSHNRNEYNEMSFKLMNQAGIDVCDSFQRRLTK